MHSGNRDSAATTRRAALERVHAYRKRVRTRPVSFRATLVVVGGLLLVASIALIVPLPEVGIPALLVALRLLAAESDWAASSYAWCDWRFRQLSNWFHRQSRLFRTSMMTVLLAATAALVWLIVYEI